MIPSVGRIVHYILPKGFQAAGEHRAAMITRVRDPEPAETSLVSLTIFLDGATETFRDGDLIDSLRHASSVAQDVTGETLGTWHEPERLEQPAASFKKPTHKK